MALRGLWHRAGHSHSRRSPSSMAAQHLASCAQRVGPIRKGEPHLYSSSFGYFSLL